jgi:regulator of RNase E activity RraB
MTDNWDFYFLHVDDKAASIFVDLGAITSAPNSNLPYMAYVRLNMKSPRADGLSSQEEYDSLKAIEDALEHQLVGEETGYIGRCTTNSCRDFFFYVAKPSDWQSRVAQCMRTFPNYTYDADTREDVQWSTYRSYLYPSEIDRQSIENRRVCDSLERHGDKLQIAREIDHWTYFANVDSRDAFVTEIAKLGFAVRSLSESSGDRRYCAQLWRADIPSLDAIDRVTLPLFDLAVKHGGEYDGWESIVVK